MLKKILYTALLSLVMIGCKKKEVIQTPDKELAQFLTNNTEGMYLNSVPVLEFDEDLHQVSVSSLTYRIQTDAQDTFLHCTLSAKPVNIKDANEITVTLKIDGNAKTTKHNVTLEKNSDKKLWLWESSSKTGFIVML